MDMHPKFKSRFARVCSAVETRKVSIGSEEDETEKTSVREAELLLSIADICNSEIKTGGLANIWREDLTLPKFPCFDDTDGQKASFPLAPRKESLKDFLAHTLSQRSRTVSIDYTKLQIEVPKEGERIEQPPALVSPIPSFERPTTPESSIRVGRLPFRSQRLSVKARRDVKEVRECSPTHQLFSEPESPSTPVRSRKSLQAPCRRGSAVKKVYRKKFSWKNLPELEQFLIANREEYLRHSALNYTVQQKQYNNALTERLLDLATEHGYVFDERDFNFVTVRDRIRCYYKSFVQSAKKRGVLMGYAARKAGLLSFDELDFAAAGIVSP
jgi:hypothetical protein